MAKDLTEKLEPSELSNMWNIMILVNVVAASLHNMEYPAIPAIICLLTMSRPYWTTFLCF